jgi:hypothetical protein
MECKAAGIDADIKIIQRWDGHRPDYRLLIGVFYADLVGRHHKILEQRKKARFPTSAFQSSTTTLWIEKLSQNQLKIIARQQ